MQTPERPVVALEASHAGIDGQAGLHGFFERSDPGERGEIQTGAVVSEGCHFGKI
jgi:hypothetical protein